MGKHKGKREEISMKLYCGRNRKGVWKASFDEDRLNRLHTETQWMGNLIWRLSE